MRQEWGEVKKAPAAFVTTLLLAAGAAWWLATTVYSGQVAGLKNDLEAQAKQCRMALDAKDETVRQKDERLALSSEWLGEYRQRLHLAPAENRYQGLSNSELR